MTYLHDVFISHASEDKEEFVRPLAEELIKLEYEVWYDEFSLKIGDSLLSSINKGITNSRYGIVVLSCHFFKKKWPQEELDGLAAMQTNGGTIILPIWHKISKEQVLEFYPILSGILALDTSIGIDEVVKKLTERLGTPLKNSSIILQYPDDKPISQSSEMDGLKLELGQNDIIEVANLLTRSGFVSSHPGRRGFCQSIGVDPNSINYSENISPADFAELLIKELVEQENQDALCKLCQKLNPKYKNGQYKKTLDDIKAKINCN